MLYDHARRPLCRSHHLQVGCPPLSEDPSRLHCHAGRGEGAARPTHRLEAGAALLGSDAAVECRRVRVGDRGHQFGSSWALSEHGIREGEEAAQVLLEWQ
ncbi:unnamed protein product [Durusdinium trenchii]|uniref:Uncharacterized protein n=1 Tax=Durusdinium trenchii TaxID=1381693 RepID=A0ABP0SMQ8_9DINO